MKAGDVPDSVKQVGKISGLEDVQRVVEVVYRLADRLTSCLFYDNIVNLV